MTAFALRKGVTVTLTGANTTGQFRAGDFDVQPGKAADAARFKMRFTLANSGSARVLTAAEKLTFLETAFDCTVRYGANMQFTPNSKLNFKAAHQLTRNGRASTWEGYTDSSTGLGQSIGSSTDVVLYPRIPFAAFWQQKELAGLWRVGALQARRIIIDVRRLAPTLPSGFSLSGNVYLDIIPDESPARYEYYSPLPRYYEFEETSRLATTLPNGWTVLLADRNAVHASTSFTAVKLTMDALTLYENCTLAEVITRYNDAIEYFPAEASVADELTLLYAIPPGVQLKDLPTGKPQFEQLVQAVTTMRFAWWGYDVMTESQVSAEVQQLANDAGCRINAVNAAAVHRLDVPKGLRAFMPWVVFREGEKEFDQYPGLVAAPGGGAVVPYVPPTVAANARSVMASQKNAGHHTAAEDTLHQVALALPGAVQSPRGLKQGSPMLERVRSLLDK